MTITEENAAATKQAGWIDELKSFLDDNWNPDLTVGEWWDRLGNAGWAAPLLPVESYGRGLSRPEAMIAASIIAQHGALSAPMGMGISLVSPTIATHGTREQIERFIPDAVCGRLGWCQLFSEPGAGSDLAGLSTKAVKDGDVWIINGQKVWTSGGHMADMGMLLARTNPTAPKHQGISWFAFDMHQEGHVEVRPLKEMTGHTMFSEVFFTDAVVNEDAVIGDVHDGWTVANTTLFHERSGMGMQRGAGVGGGLGAMARAGTIANDLGKRAGDFVRAPREASGPKGKRERTSPASLYINLAKEVGKNTDPAIRQRLAQAHILGELARFNGERGKAVRAKGGDIPGLPNFSKLLTADILRLNRDLGLQLLGARGMLHAYTDEQRATLKDAPLGTTAHAITGQALGAQALPIFGGTDQIQKNIASERALGLPKEPGDLSRVPFNELPKNGEPMPDLQHWAKETPDALAIVAVSGETRTFTELNANANRLARALRNRGLVAGDAVALIASNQPAFGETVAAVARAGFRLTPVNFHLTAEEAAYIVDDCEAKAVIATSDVAAMARDCLRAAPACKVALLAGGETHGFESYEAALAVESDEELEDPTPGSQMMYTSGTTGRPKGVHRPPLTGAAATTSTSINLAGYNEAGGDVHLCTGPLYHAAPLAFSYAAPLTYGATVVLMDKWSAEETLRLIAAHRVTHTHMVPTMFHRLLSLPDDVRARYDISSLRHVLHGAAPCPVPVKQRMIEWLGPIIMEYYAASEGVGSFVDSNTWLEHPGTVGRPFGPGQVMIGDEEGNELPSSEIGLVFLKSPAATRFQYFKDEEKTAASFRGEYFTLGDVGYLDDDGFLYLTDRSANLIISGGVNIYPAEVDAVLLEHPAVGDAAVIGVPDEEWGEAVLAVIELKKGVEPSDALKDELLVFCRDRLSHYKCPREVEFIDALPREDNGKIYKRRLREQYRSLRS